MMMNLLQTTKTECNWNQWKEYQAQMEYHAHLQAFIDWWCYNANHVAQAQSQIKILEKLPKLEPLEEDEMENKSMVIYCVDILVKSCNDHLQRWKRYWDLCYNQARLHPGEGNPQKHQYWCQLGLLNCHCNQEKSKTQWTITQVPSRTWRIVQEERGCSLMYQSVAVGSACGVTRYMNKPGCPYIKKKPKVCKLVKNPRIAMRLL